ncbi:MAG: aminotransferase class V-fold PLP-dependent enzyme [Candidatus Omnitrophota bacterium]|nr:MAG: aminotransferase class V-fold PLP-dependent enzyme [Candidatus Omnitrophota bacterium]
MCKQIYLDAPNVGELEKKYLIKAVDSDYVSTIGPYVPEFEDIFACYLGINRAVSIQSGTGAIHIALHELKVSRGDEVIVPCLTFVASVNPVIYVGAKPVFVDVDDRTWNIDPKEIEKSITKRTKAIIPVHFYGNPCNMDEIMRIAKKYNLYVIEDAAESLGARYRDRYTGTFGDLGCFSFNGNKIITTGGGGMVVGNNADRLKHIKFLVNQGQDKTKGYYYPEIGFNYRMTNIEAALGLAQMEKLDNFLTKKKTFNKIYREELGDIDIIRFQEEYQNAKSSWWLTSIIFDKDIDISALQKRLKEKGIPARRVFMPVTESAPYRQYKQADFGNSYQIYEKGLCLPSSTLNSEDNIYYVCRIIKESI